MLLAGKSGEGAAPNASNANAVGSTQLAVRGVQPQPRNESSCEFRLAPGRSFCTKRRSGELSRGKSSHSHCKPALTCGADAGCWASTAQACDVVQLPVAICGEAGQEPSASCALRR